MVTPAKKEEARTLVAIVAGKEPTEIDSFIVIVNCGDEQGVFTDQCLVHAVANMGAAIQSVVTAGKIEDENEI